MANEEVKAFVSLTVAGKPVQVSDHVAIVNPSDETVVGQCPIASPADVENAISAAKSAFPAWSSNSWTERQALILACADAIEAHADELAILLTREQGKPLSGTGSRFELGGTIAWTRHTASLTLPVEEIGGGEDRGFTVHHRPLGVVASITPWNWPLMIAAWHIMPAMLAGNTVVIKPSPFTPLSTLRMIEILNGVLPAGVLNCIAGDDSIGPILTGHTDIAKVVFTGSIATGRKVMSSAASTLKRLTLELGGNDAGIVLPDADPSAIAEGLFWGAFINGGQTCAALKRLYVHADIHDAVCDALLAYASNIPVGDGLDESNLIGPVQNRAQRDKVARLVEAAKADGARVLCGGEVPQIPGHFYPVTLVADARDGMALVDEEQFGPALPIVKYTDLDDVIARANGLEVGLGGSVWSADPVRAAEIATRMQCGSVWINNHGAIRPDAPFGGVKASGIGVEFGVPGLREFTSLQVIHN